MQMRCANHMFCGVRWGLVGGSAWFYHFTNTGVGIFMNES